MAKKVNSSTLDDSVFARSVLDSQVARIAVLDANCIIIAVNEPWKKFATDNGASRETIEGIGIDYFATAGASGDPEVLTALDGIRQVLEHKSPVFSYEYYFDLPDGKFWFEMFVTPLKNKQGGVVVTHYSIDERKRAELLILQQRAHLNAIFHGAEEGIIAISSRNQIARINDPGLKILGLDKENVIGKQFGQLFDGELKVLDDHVNKTLKKGEITRDLRIEADLPAGYRVLFVNVRPLEVEGYDFHEALVVIRDKTRLYTLQREAENRLEQGELIGQSERMKDVYNLVKQVAPSKTTVLLLGESGTGKGIISSLIHKYSERKDGPFVAVNCAALSDTLLQSELFGHVKGAFTGAVANRTGRFQRANGGTIFLDEIGDITPAMQVALLRVLEEKQFERLGDTRTLTTDARVVAATNRNLYSRVQDGKFREDLFYRLNVVTVHVPPLRDRKDDIPLLADHFRVQLNKDMGARIEHIEPETMDLLQAHEWPGNVRELRNTMERAFIMCKDHTILPLHLPEEVLKVPGSPDQKERSPQQTVIYSRKRIDKATLLGKLEELNWNITHTARELGYTRQYIYYLMKKFKIESK